MLSAVLVLTLQCTTIIVFGSSIHKNPGYQYSYFVRDVRTGDFKTQEETREGDTVKGSYSVGEPNGDLRVVTYHADKDTGFNANVQVQPGGMQMLNNAYNQQGLANIMRIMPRYQLKTGFPQLPIEIKVVPPVGSPSAMENETLVETQEQQTENKSEVDIVTQEPESVTTEIPEETTANVPTENVDDKIETKDLKESENINEKDYQEHMCKVICNQQKKEEEGRAHLKPNEDKVQVEMEQTIRAEMQEPTAVNLGIPYEQSEYATQNVKGNYYTRQEIINNQFTTRPPSYSHNYQQMAPPPFYQSKIFLLPFNINSNDYLTLRPFVHRNANQPREEQSGKTLFQQISTPAPSPSWHVVKPQTNIESQTSRIYPLYTTGLAFVVMPRLQ